MNATLHRTFLIVAAVLVLASTTLAQRAEPPQEKPAARPETQFKIFTLVNSDAQDTARLLTNLFPENLSPTSRMRVAVDQRTNSIIVSADADQLNMVEAVLIRLDEQEVPAKDTTSLTRVLTFQSINPNDLANRLRQLKLRASFQVSGNNLTIQGPQDVLDKVEALMRELDQPPAPPQSMRVRLIWLLAGKEDDERLASLAEPPGDLKPVLEELAGLGINGPKLATQMVVYGTAGSHNLQLNGSLGEPLASRVDVSGELFDKPSPTPSLRLHIGISGGAGSGGGRGGFNTSLNTQISTPPGHFVVLGATPMESLTSVFVVQVTPKSQAGDANSATASPDEISPPKAAPKSRP